MTINEILACKIPEGIYYFALDKLREHIDSDKCHEIYLDEKVYESICKSFSALYELAKEPNGAFRLISDPLRFEKAGYYLAIQNVLNVVDDSLNEGEDYTQEELNGATEALIRLKNKIEKMVGK